MREKFIADGPGSVRAQSEGAFEMYQAMFEFLDNSYSNEAVNILIKAVGGEEYDIIVADDGSGMSPAQLVESLTFALKKERSSTDIWARTVKKANLKQIVCGKSMQSIQKKQALSLYLKK